MRKRIFSLLATTMVVFAACNGASTSPSPSTAPASQPAASSGGESGSPAESGSAGPSASSGGGSGSLNDALFNTSYKPVTDAQPGGTLIMGEWQPPDTLQPFFSTAYTTVEAITPALRGFATITSDGKYIPDLAASIPTVGNGVTIAPDGKTFTVQLTLRPNLKWSDGKPLTMNDFKATWQWATDKAQSGCSSCTVGWPEIDNVDVSSDGLSATLHFKELYAGWLGFLTGAFFQADWLKSFPVADSSKSMPNSSAIANVPFSGPFVITNASKTEIDYAPNPNWAGGVDLAVGGQTHAPYLAGLKFQFFDTKDGEIAAFKSGAIDIALDMTQADYSTIQSVDPSVGTAELTPSWQYEHLDINNDPTHARGNGLWDPAIRKAIAMAVNKDDMIAAIFPGQQTTAACSPAPPGLWYRSEVTCPAFDVEGSKAALDAANMKVGASGNREYNGKEVDLELCTTAGNPTRLTELQKLQGYLQAVNIKSHIKTADAGSVVFAGWADTKPDTDCALYRGNYDLGDFAYIIGADPYNNYFYTYATSQWPEKGDHSGANDTRFSDPNMDAALTALKTDVDLNKQLADAKTVQDAYNTGIPEIPIYYRSETTGLSVHVGGWPGYNPSSIGPTWNVENWWYKP
jgi:peptide/nickel transport system substrate-binding protein